jgi:hypothetical protein
MRWVLVGAAAIVVAIVLTTRPRHAHTRAPKPIARPELSQAVPAPEVAKPLTFNARFPLQVFVIGPNGKQELGTTPCTSGVTIPDGGLWGVAPIFPNPTRKRGSFAPDVPPFGGMEPLVAALRGTGVRALSLADCHGLRDWELAGLAELTQLEWLNFSNCRYVTGDALAHMSPLRRLSHLYLDHSSFGDEGMAWLAAFPDLRYVDLSQTRVSARGLVHLPALRALEGLSLTIPQGGDEAMLYVAALPRLEELGLWGGDLSPVGMSHLRGAPRLRRLDLAFLRVRPETLSPLAGHPTVAGVEFSHVDGLDVDCVARLRQLPALRELDFYGGDAFTAEHMAHLSRIEQMERLTVESVTDAGMQHLGRLERLKALELDDAQITDAGAFFLADLPPVAPCSECSSPRDRGRGPGTPRSAHEPGRALAVGYECG